MTTLAEYLAGFPHSARMHTMLSRIATPDPALVDDVCARANAEQTGRRAAQMTKQNIRVVLKALAAELVT